MFFCVITQSSGASICWKKWTLWRSIFLLLVFDYQAIADVDVVRVMGILDAPVNCYIYDI